MNGSHTTPARASLIPQDPRQSSRDRRVTTGPNVPTGSSCLRKINPVPGNSRNVLQLHGQTAEHSACLTTRKVKQTLPARHLHPPCTRRPDQAGSHIATAESAVTGSDPELRGTIQFYLHTQATDRCSAMPHLEITEEFTFQNTSK